MKSNRYTTPQDTEAAFYEALENADLAAMMTVWAEDEDIVCVHPGGPRLTGTAAIRESWRRIFSQGPTLRFRLSDLQMVRGALLAVHSLHEHILISGQQEPQPPVITTNVYTLTEQGWRMVMHHASLAPNAPEGRNGTTPAPGMLH